MTIHIINADDQLDAGWINLIGKSMPSIGLKPKTKRGNIQGIAFNNKEELKKARDFLAHAYKELYGDEHHGSGTETGKSRNPRAGGEGGVRKKESGGAKGSQGTVP